MVRPPYLKQMGMGAVSRGTHDTTSTPMPVLATVPLVYEEFPAGASQSGP
jgi:hypothetical protein